MDWFQQSLVEARVYEVRLRVGMVPATDHLQWQVEAFDAETRVLIASTSLAHASLAEWPAALRPAVRALENAIADVLEDPFAAYPARGASGDVE